jgi:hypothetical protein
MNWGRKRQAIVYRQSGFLVHSSFIIHRSSFDQRQPTQSGLPDGQACVLRPLRPGRFDDDVSEVSRRGCLGAINAVRQLFGVQFASLPLGATFVTDLHQTTIV